MHLKTVYQVNARTIHVAENLNLIMQSTLPGVLTGENCIGVGTIFEAQSSTSTTVLITILSAHHFS